MAQKRVIRACPCGELGAAHALRHPAVMPCIVTGDCRPTPEPPCVRICPSECFFDDGTRVYVDPGTCIDCFACIPVCPQGAIFGVTDPHPRHSEWIALADERISSGVAWPILPGQRREMR